MNQYLSMHSPLGKILLEASDSALLALRFSSAAPFLKRRHPILEQARQELEEYFSGTRKEFTVALDPIGTEFDKKVWDALQKIPFGETSSYGELAEKIGVPGGARAVGNAAGRNPIPVIIPCHRLLAANLQLGGFSAGLHRKTALLTLEGVLPRAPRRVSPFLQSSVHAGI